MNTQVWIHTSLHRFTEIGQICQNKRIFNNINKNKLSKLKSPDEIIRRSARLSSGENRTCHWPGPIYHSLLMVNPHWPPPSKWPFQGGACPPQPPKSLHLQHSFSIGQYLFLICACIPLIEVIFLFLTES